MAAQNFIMWMWSQIRLDLSFSCYYGLFFHWEFHYKFNLKSTHNSQLTFTQTNKPRTSLSVRTTKRNRKHPTQWGRNRTSGAVAAAVHEFYPEISSIEFGLVSRWTSMLNTQTYQGLLRIVWNRIEYELQKWFFLKFCDFNVFV